MDKIGFALASEDSHLSLTVTIVVLYVGRSYDCNSPRRFKAVFKFDFANFVCRVTLDT
jgi:hypothetical protein